MIGLMENAEHQVTVAGAFLLTEARSLNVDVTGWSLLDAPEVTVNGDGSITLRIAVPDKAPSKRAKAAPVVAEDEPIAEDIADV